MEIFDDSEHPPKDCRKDLDTHLFIAFITVIRVNALQQFAFHILL